MSILRVGIGASVFGVPRQALSCGRRVAQLRGAFNMAARPFRIGPQMFYNAPEKWSDRPAVFGDTLLARTFRTLPLGYSLSGIAMLWHSGALGLYGKEFFWRSLGTSLVFQGPVCYLADVHDFGRRVEDSHWKRIDTTLASTLTFLASVGFVCSSWFGAIALPARTTNTWAVGCAVGIGSKCMGSHASHQPSTSIETLMWWANVWHCLPLLALILLWDLGQATEVPI